MKLRLLISFVVLIFSLVVERGWAAAQSEVPPEAVNTWSTIDLPQDYEVFSFFSDASYTEYWKHYSTLDRADPTCQARVIAARGTTIFNAGQVTLVENRHLETSSAACNSPALNGIVQMTTLQQFTLPVQFDPNGYMTLNGISFSGNYGVRTLTPISTVGDEAISSLLIGNWTYKLSSACDYNMVCSNYAGTSLIFSTNGTYSETSTVGGAGSGSSVQSASGIAQVSDLVLTLQPSNANAEQHIWWLANDSSLGTILYIDGTPYRLSADLSIS